MRNTNSEIYKYFFSKKTFPKGLISYWKNNNDSDEIPKLPPFPIRMYRQIAYNNFNSYEAENINAKNLWNRHNIFLHKELLIKYEFYKQIYNKKII